MTLTRLSAAALAAFLTVAAPALAQQIAVEDPYVRASTPASTSGAIFFTLVNGTDSDDRLTGVSTAAAEMAELHTHAEDAMGVMRMGEIEGGVELPAGASHEFARGGDHVMLMGLTGPLEQGEEITLTLTFETAGDIEVTVPVDHERKPAHGAMKH
jgi:periplasmic copper chaperone A